MVHNGSAEQGFHPGRKPHPGKTETDSGNRSANTTKASSLSTRRSMPTTSIAAPSAPGKPRWSPEAGRHPAASGVRPPATFHLWPWGRRMESRNRSRSMPATPACSGAAEAGPCQDEERPSRSHRNQLGPNRVQLAHAVPAPRRCTVPERRRPGRGPPGPDRAQSGPRRCQHHAAPAPQRRHRRAISTTGPPPVTGATAPLHGCHGRAERL
jgi:hypothetical protein